MTELHPNNSTISCTAAGVSFGSYGLTLKAESRFNILRNQAHSAWGMYVISDGILITTSCDACQRYICSWLRRLWRESIKHRGLIFQSVCAFPT